METGDIGTHPDSTGRPENTTGIANPPLIEGDTMTVDSGIFYDYRVIIRIMCMSYDRKQGMVNTLNLKIEVSEIYREHYNIQQRYYDIDLMAC